MVLAKEILKTLMAWAVVVSIFLLLILLNCSCSGNQKPTINMQNCIVVESATIGEFFT